MMILRWGLISNQVKLGREARVSETLLTVVRDSRLSCEGGGIWLAVTKTKMVT